MSAPLTTRDLGFYVRDALDTICVIEIDRVDDADADDIDRDPSGVRVNAIDTSDIENMRIQLTNGQMFTLRIVAGDRA